MNKIEQQPQYRELAAELMRAGLTPVAVRQTTKNGKRHKMPVGYPRTLLPITEQQGTQAKHPWGQWRYRDPTPEELDWSFQRANAIGVITRGGLESLDIDTKHAEPGEITLEKVAAIIKPYLQDPTIYQTPSGGYQIPYFCLRATDKPKKKLCRGRSGECIIEVLSNGLYFNIAPSEGYAKLMGRLDRAPLLTLHERDHLHMLLRQAFDQDWGKAPPKPTQKKKRLVHWSDNRTPWERYNAEATIDEVVADIQWWADVVGETQHEWVVQRHGATNATSGGIRKSDHTIHIFSTGCPHQVVQAGSENAQGHVTLSPFGARLARILAEGGDMATAVKSIKEPAPDWVRKQK